MQPTSQTQFDAVAGGTVPPLEEVREGVWALPQAMPNPQLPYTLSYLIVDADDRVHVIDPGWDSDENVAALDDALGRIGRSLGQVASATSTHLHLDHTGLAGRLREASGARIALSRIDQNALESQSFERRPSHTDADFRDWGVPSDRLAELREGFMSHSGPAGIPADVVLDRGDVLSIPGRTISVISTPGHTAGSICLVDADARLIFTGDHLLPMIFPGVGLGGHTPDNPVSEYVASLELLAPFDGWEVLPGHGYRFTGLGERREQSAEHHNRRTRETATVLDDHPEATVWQIAAQLHWSAGWAALEGPYLRSALAQTAMHAERVRTGGWARYQP